MRILAIGSLAFSAAVFLEQYAFPNKFNIAITVLLLAAGMISMVLHSKKGKIATLIFIPMAFGVLYSGLYTGIALSTAEDMAGNILEIRAEAVGFSEERDYGRRVTVKIETPNGKNVKSLLYIYAEETNYICPGDIITVEARLALSNKMYGKDIDTYQSKGIYLFAYQVTSEPIKIERCSGISIKYFPQYAAKRLSEAADKVFVSSAVPFMKAILIGDRTALYDDMKLVNDLQISGIFHVVAVSGMHIAFVVGLVILLCNKNRRLAAAVTIPVLVIYMLITGAQPPVQRAVIMQIMILAAPLVYREYDGLTSISTALALILFANPFAAKSIGLQLSFAATFGIILQAQRLYDIILCKSVKRVLEHHKLFDRLARGVTGYIAASISAMIFTVPLTAAYFGYVSLIAFVTNVAIIWLIPICFEIGLISAVIGVVYAPIGFVIGLIPSAAAKIIALSASKLASLKFAAVYTINPYIVIWLVLMYLLIMISMLSKSRMRGVITTCVIGTVSFCIAVLLSTISFDNSKLEVTALDIGQGQCIVINTEGRTVMVDCGGDYADAGKIASEYVLSSGNHKVDLLVMTHFDSDHINGFGMLASRVKISALAIPDREISDTKLTETVCEIAEESEIEVIRVTEDMCMTIDNISINLIAMAKNGYLDENNGGLVVIASEGDFDVLITGDINYEAEQKIVSEYDLPDIEVIVAGHHGSKYSTGSEILDAVTPETAIISVGTNSYGHPADEVLERLRERGIIILRTDLLGNVTVRSQ